MKKTQYLTGNTNIAIQGSVFYSVKTENSAKVYNNNNASSSHVGKSTLVPSFSNPRKMPPLPSESLYYKSGKTSQH